MFLLEKLFNFKKEELKDEIPFPHPALKHDKAYLKHYCNELYRENLELKEKCEKKIDKPEDVKQAIDLVNVIPFSFDSLFYSLSPDKLNKIEIVSFYGYIKDDKVDENSLPCFRNIVFVYYYDENNERVKYLECPISKGGDGGLYNIHACKRREINYNLCRFIATYIKENIEHALLKTSLDVEITMIEDKIDALINYDETKV